MPEVYFPGSADPFRPLNPWGRSMPKVAARSGPPQLWQVFVTWPARGRHPIAIGPRMEKSFAEALCETITNAVRCGAEREWTNPHIEKVASVHQPQGQKTLRDLIMEKM